MKSTVIIQGSANSFGNTYKVIQYLNTKNDFDVIDLATKNINHFSYDFSNNDDFLPLMQSIIEKYDTIIFATPVYWYTMSGHLKVFFDRMSDLLHAHKNLGRQLRGKNMAMLSNSGSNDLIPSFNEAFKASANYLGMNYLADTHAWFTSDGKAISEEAKLQLDSFYKKIDAL